MKISDIKLAVYNPRKIDPENLKRLCKSIKDFSDTVEKSSEFRLPDPIIINKRNNVLIGGHQRIKALELLRQDFVNDNDIRFVDCDEKTEKALNIALNNPNLMGEYDYPKLKEIITFLDDCDFDITKIGFDDIQIKDMFDYEKDYKTEPNDIPEISEKEPISKIGDLYILGNHRLLCGDSTNKEDVKLLMNGENAILTLTDPPYSVNYKSRKENINETLKSFIDPKNADEGQELLYNFMSIMPSNFIIMSYADKHLHDYVLVCEKLKFETIDILIWVKQNFCFWAGARYQKQHELIFLARKKGTKIISNTLSNQSTVLKFDRQIKNNIHPTQKPYELFKILCNYHSNKNDNIYEPFAGSGTTLIVCEDLKRKCYAIELSPYFIDVIITRYCNFVGNNNIIKNGKQIKWELSNV